MSRSLLFLLFFVMSGSQAQQFSIEKVTEADLLQKQHPKDASAEAAVLYRIGMVRFRYDKESGFVLETTVRTRIKIYSKDGYKWGDAVIDFYTGSNSSSREKLTISDAVTYNLVDGKIEKTKLRNDGIFETKKSKYWSEKKIAMPNVKEGAIIEYEYTLQSPHLFRFTDWDFQDEIPVDYSELTTTIPEYFVYSHNQRGGYVLDISTSVAQNSIHFSDKYRSDGRVTQTTYDEYDVNFSETKTVYKAKDMPALHDDRYVNNYRNYLCSISHELMMTKMPHAAVKSYSSDWNKVAKTIYESEDFGGELGKTGYYEDAIKPLIAGMSMPDEKIGAIFGYVRSNVKWDGTYGYACDSGVRKALKEKTGNAAEINLMLTSMLRYAGLEADPVLISTRSHVISLFPNLTSFNYVICAVKIGDVLAMLDATDPYSTPDVLPLRDLNWRGRLVRKDGSSEEIPMTPSSPSRENISLMFSLDAQGNIEGKCRRQISDNLALDFRQRHLERHTEQFLEELENRNGHIEISEYKRDNDRELAKPVVESYSFRKKAAAEQIGDKLYLTPMLFLASPENPFKMESREYPVDFGFPTVMKSNVIIDIPAGYTVESLPAGTALATEGNLGSFRYSIAETSGKLQLLVTSEINQCVVGPDAYGMLKDFFQKMADKQNEKIVFKKM